MSDGQTAMPTSVGLDDGYAFTKLALPDGRLVAIPSRARIGHANVTWLNATRQRLFEYETEGTVFAVGDVDGEPTHFEEYPCSGLNRAIVQHALMGAGLGGQSVHAVSGLPVSSFYFKDGSQRSVLIGKKRDSLKQDVKPADGRLPVSVAFHEVIPEALAAWYDHVITERDGGVQLEAERLAVPVAVIDIGGRTTDFVVVADQALRHDQSGSLRCGMLDYRRLVIERVCSRFDLDVLSERTIDEALHTGRVRLFGRTHAIGEEMRAARQEIVVRLHAETRRQLGRGAELERILFVGGGAVALSEDIRDWFPNQAIAAHPSFANARGMLKYLRYVCQVPG